MCGGWARRPGCGILGRKGRRKHENPAAEKRCRGTGVCLSRKATGELRKPCGGETVPGDGCLPDLEGSGYNTKTPRQGGGGREAAVCFSRKVHGKTNENPAAGDRGAGRLIQKRDTVRVSVLTGREPSGKRLRGRRSVPGRRRWRPHRRRSRSAAGPWRRWQRTGQRHWRPAAADGRPCRRR